MVLKIKKTSPAAQLPQRATPGSAGFDLCACCGEEGIRLAPMERRAVPTGIAVQLPGAEYVALIFARSGQALKAGLALANGVGVVDSDYRGEVLVPMVNLSASAVHIANGERIAQMVLMPVALPAKVELVAELDDTPRGAGGFGSTGSR